MVERYIGDYVSAKSALKEIDPQEIAAACDAIGEAAQGFTIKAQELSVASSECDKTALCINDNTIEGTVNEVAGVIAHQTEVVCAMVDGLPKKALDKHNELQRRYNDEAREADNRARIAAEERRKKQNNN